MASVNFPDSIKTNAAVCDRRQYFFRLPNNEYEIVYHVPLIISYWCPVKVFIVKGGADKKCKVKSEKLFCTPDCFENNGRDLPAVHSGLLFPYIVSRGSAP